ncbi:hypothetical protein EDB84DRAFT_1444415 [Lactarius hengduanensis]|nr:hypothetical protein EDB84DRAFT_1444415 [Lactarius hengduanensis]
MSMLVPVAEPAVASESSHVATLSYRVVRVAVDVVLPLLSDVGGGGGGGGWRLAAVQVVVSRMLCRVVIVVVVVVVVVVAIAVVFVVVAVRYLAVVDGRALEMAVAVGSGCVSGKCTCDRVTKQGEQNETGITRPGNESGTHALCTYAANHDQDNFDNTAATTTTTATTAATTATTATTTGTTATTNGENGYDNGDDNGSDNGDNGSDNGDNGDNDRDNGDDKRRKRLRQRRVGDNGCNNGDGGDAMTRTAGSDNVFK